MAEWTGGLAGLPWLAVVVVVLLALLVAQQLARCAVRVVRRRRFQFAGQHYLVTGGSKGLGKALSKELARRGARVSILARDITSLQFVEYLIESQPSSAPSDGSSRVFISGCDVTDERDLRRAVSECVSVHGPVDCLIPCAGTLSTNYFPSILSSTFASDMEVNYFGVLHALRCVVPDMMSRGTGRVVFICSEMVLLPRLGFSSHCASKGAVWGLAEALSNELSRFPGLSIHIAFPPSMATQSFEVDALSRPVEAQQIQSNDRIYSPSSVAQSILSGMASGDARIMCGNTGRLISSGIVGMSYPSNYVWDLLSSGLSVLVGRLFRTLMDGEVKRHKYRFNF